LRAEAECPPDCPEASPDDQADGSKSHPEAPGCYRDASCDPNDAQLVALIEQESAKQIAFFRQLTTTVVGGSAALGRRAVARATVVRTQIDNQVGAGTADFSHGVIAGGVAATIPGSPPADPVTKTVLYRAGYLAGYLLVHLGAK
jgi:hypothetical protein